jgi:hypothetical protein
MNKPKKIIVMDFDGVIHSYKSKWQGIDEINDEPVPGVKEFIKEVRKYYQVHVLSSRTASLIGKEAVIKWLDKYGIEVDRVTSVMSRAYIIINDRTICFNGYFEGLKEQIDTFEPWTNKRKLL